MSGIWFKSKQLNLLKYSNIKGNCLPAQAAAAVHSGHLKWIIQARNPENDLFKIQNTDTDLIINIIGFCILENYRFLHLEEMMIRNLNPQIFIRCHTLSNTFNSCCRSSNIKRSSSKDKDKHSEDLYSKSWVRFLPESCHISTGVKLGMVIFWASILFINRSITAQVLSMDRCKMGK